MTGIEKRKMNGISRIVFLPLLSVMMFCSCYRGEPSDKPPVHPNPNMYDQPKYKAQSESEFFADRATMRTPVEGTVGREWQRDDDAYFRGMDKNGDFIEKAPLELTEKGLLRGRERFDIYCSICHGAVGDARSIMVEKGFIAPPSFHQDRIRNMPDGQLFDTISNGIRNMPSYKNQIRVEDRWRIIQYMRALQRSQNARIDDIPKELRGNLK